MAKGRAGARPICSRPPFGRRLDLSWRRTSYTRHHHCASRAEPSAVSPRSPAPPTSPIGGRAEAGPSPPASAFDPGPDPDRLRESRACPRSPLAETPGGPEVGTFVHGVLERVDFAAGDLAAAVARAFGQQVTASRYRVAETLAAGLTAAVDTTGPPCRRTAPSRHRPADRIDELASSFRSPAATALPARCCWPTWRVCSRPTFRPGTALAGYAARLAGPALATHLRGYLTGSLDLVLRARRAEARPISGGRLQDQLAGPGR